MGKSRSLKRLGKKKAPTVKVTKTVKVPKMKDTTKAGVLAVVKRLLNRGTENKLIGNPVELNIQHNSGITAPDCYPLIPQITQGVAANQRIGDKVVPKSLRVRGVVSFTPDTCTTSQNIYVRIVILAQKNIKVGSAVNGGVDTSRLLRPGFIGAGADQVPFTGTTNQLLMPVNKDLFRVYMDKTIKLTCAVVTGGGVEQMPMYSARWGYNFKQLPASLTWDEGNGDWANNFAPFVALGYAFSDGSAPDVITTRLIHNCNAFLEYEDA